MAHKEQYKLIDKTLQKQLNLLIVVDQMLTGFDSKWVNTLYLDKMLEYENIIQAFSRTNRIFRQDEKPFGTIRYYRKPHTMEKNIEAAVKLYSGDRPVDLFVDKLGHNIEKLNGIYQELTELFTNAGIPDFEKLPDEKSVKAKFASLFKDFNGCLEAAKVQGFNWDKHSYADEETGKTLDVMPQFTQTQYLVLVQRYKELTERRPGDRSGEVDVPYDLVGYIIEIDTGRIDADYMNSRFDKYMKLIHQDDATAEAQEEALNELHKTFAALTQDEQKYANIFLHDIQRGDVSVEEGKSLRDYITEYLYRAKNAQVHQFAATFDLDEEKLRNMMSLGLTLSDINEFGRFDELFKTFNKEKAKLYFEEQEGKKIVPPKVNIKMDKLLRQFILEGGFEI